MTRRRGEGGGEKQAGVKRCRSHTYTHSLSHFLQLSHSVVCRLDGFVLSRVFWQLSYDSEEIVVGPQNYLIVLLLQHHLARKELFGGDGEANQALLRALTWCSLLKQGRAGFRLGLDRVDSMQPFRLVWLRGGVSVLSFCNACVSWQSRSRWLLDRSLDFFPGICQRDARHAGRQAYVM